MKIREMIDCLLEDNSPELEVFIAVDEDETGNSNVKALKTVTVGDHPTRKRRASIILWPKR